MGREWKPVGENERMVGNHAIFVFWFALVTLSIIATIIFSCAEGAPKRDSNPENQSAACGTTGGGYGG